MENKDGEFNIEDELASIKPRRSDDNPIPARVARQREESIKRAAIEHEKDYYADKKPKKTNTHHTFNNHNNENDWFDTIHESTESVPTSLSDCFPIIPTNEIYLQSGEKCYFKGIIQLVETKVQKDYIHKSLGRSTPGLFKGNRWGSSVSWRKEIGEHTEAQYFTGILYVTNKRSIFVEKTKGYDKRHTSISAINEFSGGLEIQYGSKTFVIITEDAKKIYELYDMLH